MNSHRVSRMVRVFVLVVFVLMNLVLVQREAFATGLFGWAKQIGGQAGAVDITVDAAGNSYVTGHFKGTVDFDPGPGTVNLTSAGFNDIFVSRLDSTGNLIWVRAMGGPEWSGGDGISLDASGNVYTVGNFDGTVDFDPGAGTYELTSAGFQDIFVAKLDSGGRFVWARSMGGAEEDTGLDIAVDSTDNVYTTGHFVGAADFDPGPGIASPPSARYYDIFVSKLDSHGDFVWAKSMGGAGFYDEGWSLAVDASGSVYVTGRFEGTVDFDPGTAVYNLTSSGWADIFVSKLDRDGRFLWAKQLGGIGDDFVLALALDTSGNVYATGWFTDTADFDPGPGTYNLTSAGYDDIFVFQLDSSGDFVWARGMGGAWSDTALGLALDAGGNVYLAGYFHDTADFDPGPGVYNLTSAGLSDIFIAKLDSSGAFVWAKRLGGVGADAGRSLAADTSGNVYTTGYFQGTADFDPGPGTYNLTSVGGPVDMFVLNLQGADSFEPDNSPGEANEITSGIPQAHNITPIADADWVTFTLPAPSTITLQAAGTADTEMWLYAMPDLVNPYGYNNDRDAEAGDHSSLLVYNCGEALPAGTYYVSVNEFESNGEIPGYQLTLSASACPVTAAFADVPVDHWAGTFVERLAGAGITGGCATAPPRYCPEETVTRAQMAVFLLRGIHASSYAPPALGDGSGFGDVPAGYWSASFIKQLAAEGITSGCGSGNYCPEQPVTRAQMAVFLLRSKYGANYTPPAVGSDTGFDDVPTNYWAAAFVKQLVTEGITAGCGGGNYCPEQPVTRAQMAVFLVRTFNLP